MSNLASFAELVKQANEEKRLKAIAEEKRKSTEVAPLLGELFASVAKAKEVRQAAIVKEAPLLNELQTALLNPEKAKVEKEVKKQKIVELVSDLESKIEVLQEKADVPDVDIDVKIDDALKEAEKKYLKLFNKLQTDLQNFKQYVDSKPSGVSSFGGAGSGEVRILRMDDMNKNVKPVEGDTLVWSETLNKFTLAQQTGGSGDNTTIYSDEEMPYAKRIDFITDNELYKGEAVVGSAEDAVLWRIRKVTIGEDSDVSETWAGGTSTYDKRWSDRLTYNYI